MPTEINHRLAERYRLIMVGVFLIASVLRLYGLNNLSPPGLEHDEVAHWLINRDILAGNLAVYYAEAYGHEAGFHYVQTGFMILLGDNALALRLPAAYAGLLLVATCFALTRRLFGISTALLSAALLAVLFWPVFYSRLGLRAISLPLLSGLSAYFWWRGWRLDSSREPAGNGHDVPRSQRQKSRLARVNAPVLTSYLLAGLLAGLSLYTYMASRVVPIFFLLFAGYLLLFHRPALKGRWPGVVLFFLVYTIVAAPLTIFLINNPGSESRISEVNGPLLALVDGDLKPALQNSLKVLGMFGVQGDPLWRQNVAFFPVFEPIVALFFYIGLLLGLWRWRQPRYLFLILWLFAAAIPSIVTIDAPSSIRIINALPILTIFPAIGLQVIHFFRPLSTVSTELSPKTGAYLGLTALLLLLGLNVARTARATFQIWPADPEVQFVWQKGLTEAATFLDGSADSGPVAIGGWTPDTMDPPTMNLSLRRDDLSLRFFDPTQSLIVPWGPDGQTSRIIRPTVLPLDPFLDRQLETWGASSHQMDNFTIYEVEDFSAVQPTFKSNTNFENQITFLGYDAFPPGRFLTYWRVEEPAMGQRRIFFHQLDENDQIIGQDDRLGAPAVHWRPGDIILQLHTLGPSPSDGPIILRLGVYDPDTGRRLAASNGLDFVEISYEE